jgi:hypothetical protein
MDASLGGPEIDPLEPACPDDAPAKGPPGGRAPLPTFIVGGCAPTSCRCCGCCCVDGAADEDDRVPTATCEVVDCSVLGSPRASRASPDDHAGATTTGALAPPLALPTPTDPALHDGPLVLGAPSTHPDDDSAGKGVCRTTPLCCCVSDRCCCHDDCWSTIGRPWCREEGAALTMGATPLNGRGPASEAEPPRFECSGAEPARCAHAGCCL